jgi:hypothetical protein
MEIGIATVKAAIGPLKLAMRDVQKGFRGGGKKKDPAINLYRRHGTIRSMMRWLN